MKAWSLFLWVFGLSLAGLGHMPWLWAQQWTWKDAQELTVEGRSWYNENLPYSRLPLKIKDQVREGLWYQSRYASGIAVRFVSDGTAIAVHWRRVEPQEEFSHMSAIGKSGLDLYVRDKGVWRWTAQAYPKEGVEHSQTLISEMAPMEREYCLYLPLFNEIEMVRIAAYAGDLRSLERRSPIVFYGTSITQGAAASRPGLVYPAAVGRMLEGPTVNLGFSGQGRMDLPIAEILAELKPAAYVIDCTANMTPEEIGEKMVSFVRILRRTHACMDAGVKKSGWRSPPRYVLMLPLG